MVPQQALAQQSSPKDIGSHVSTLYCLLLPSHVGLVPTFCTLPAISHGTLYAAQLSHGQHPEYNLSLVQAGRQLWATVHVLAVVRHIYMHQKCSDIMTI